jgi:hypothetical protein
MDFVISIKQGLIKNMKQVNYLLIGAPALLAVTLAFTPLVHAESGRGSSGSTTVRVEDDSTTKVAETETATENETEVHTTDSTSAQRSEEVAKRRAELQAKLQAMKEEVKTRLAAKRLEACEKHSDKINGIIQKRSEQATKQLAVFTKISDRVQTFVTDKNLTVENYDTLVAAINDKEASAQAAIEANTATKFDCNTASADKPLQVPRTSVEAVRTALHDYRTAIKNLIVNVKASAEKEEAADSTKSTGSTESSTTSTSTTTGEVSQ